MTQTRQEYASLARHLNGLQGIVALGYRWTRTRRPALRGYARAIIRAVRAEMRALAALDRADAGVGDRGAAWDAYLAAKRARAAVNATRHIS